MVPVRSGGPRVPQKSRSGATGEASAVNPGQPTSNLFSKRLAISLLVSDSALVCLSLDPPLILVILSEGDWILMAASDVGELPVCPALPLSLSGRALWGGGRSGGCRWPAGGVEQLGPGGLPRPVAGQVQPQPAGGAGQPGGNGDELRADGGGGGLAVKGRGQRAGGAGEVERDRRQLRLAGVGGEAPGGQVG